MSEPRVLTIERLGQRGEGVARTDEGNVFVPYTMPGDTIRAPLASPWAPAARPGGPAPPVFVFAEPKP